MSNKITEEAAEIRIRDLLSSLIEANTTIAQLREENERYRKCLEFIRHQAYASEPYLYSPDVLAFIEKSLTPKQPKIKG